MQKGTLYTKVYFTENILLGRIIILTCFLYKIKTSNDFFIII